MKRLASQRGFTLMEMLVATFIFIIAMTIVLDIFMLAQRAQRKAVAYERIQADTRYIVNKIADETRDGTLDYSYYTTAGIAIDSANGNDVLAIKTFNGKTLLFQVSDAAGTFCANPTDITSKPCLLQSDDGGATWAQSSSKGTSIERLHFYISPDKSPFVINPATNDYDVSEQPLVRMVVDMKGTITSTTGVVRMQTQTSFATREYKR